MARERRAELLRAKARAARQLDVEAEGGNSEAVGIWNEVVGRYLRRYFEELPMLSMSCCPFCGLPLLRSFDPFGLDGPWWRRSMRRLHPEPCPHFCVLRGAMNWRGLRPRGGTFPAHVGPEVPYVIPRLLEMKTMLAVIGTLQMETGYTVYTIAYFAERRPPDETLVANWPDQVHHFKDAEGRPGWREERDTWDFELGPWLERGKLRWCEPGSGNTALSLAAPSACPYVGLQGRRERIVVQEDDSWSDGLP